MCWKEALGEMAKAAAAYAVVGDIDGEARALAQAGDVDKLETLLTNEHAKESGARRKREVHADMDLLMASGRRREALALAEAFSNDEPGDGIVRDQARVLRSRMLRGPKASLLVRQKKLELLVGDDVVIGRTEGSLTVPSHAVSRRHLRIARDEAGVPTAIDLGSRNGTELRGMRIAGALPIGDGLDLKLGGEVPLRITKAPDFDGAVMIHLGGESYVAPLGPMRIGIGAWRIEASAAGWLELVTDDAPPAIASGIRFVSRATLLIGDAITDARGAEPILRVLGGS